MSCAFCSTIKEVNVEGSQWGVSLGMKQKQYQGFKLPSLVTVT